MVEASAGTTIPAIFASQGETAFRDMETAAVKEAGKQLSAVIATGGGSVLREENRAALQQNGVMIYLRKDLSQLARDGRPLSKDAEAVRKLYEERKSIYETFADYIIDVDDDPQITTERVITCIS